MQAVRASPIMEESKSNNTIVRLVESFDESSISVNQSQLSVQMQVLGGQDSEEDLGVQDEQSELDTAIDIDMTINSHFQDLLEQAGIVGQDDLDAINEN